MSSSSMAGHPDYSFIESNLIVGDYPTASDVALLEGLGVSHVVSCGFDQAPDSVAGHPYGSQIRYCFLAGLDDLPSANLFQHLPKTVSFMEDALGEKSVVTTDNINGEAETPGSKNVKKGPVVLVHCAFGQSRSCAVCVAYLMAKKSRSLELSQTLLLLHDCYELVYNSRSCLAINPGFIRQLELYRRMLVVPSKLVSSATPRLPFSSAYASYRASRIQSEVHAGLSQLSTFCPSPSNLRKSGFDILEKTYRCKKCRYELFVTSNILDEMKEEDIERLPVSERCRASAKGKAFAAGALFSTQNKLSDDPYLHVTSKEMHRIEPIDWMRSAITLSRMEGKLLCPNCTTKLGSYKYDKNSFFFKVDIICSKIE